MGNLIQLPLYIGMFFAIRYMSFSPEAFPHLHQVSFLYMDRIVEPDPFFLTPLLSAITTFLTIKYNRKMQPPSTNPQAAMMSQLMYFIQFTPFLAMFVLGTYPAILNMYWWSVAFTNFLITYGSNSKWFKKANGLDKPIPGTILFNQELKKIQKNQQIANAFLSKEERIAAQKNENDSQEQGTTAYLDNKTVKVFKKKPVKKNKKD